MEDIQYKAFVVEEQNGEFIQTIQSRSTGDLAAGDVLVRVHYSSLNYKDALSATGNKGVTKKYPHTPGIDAAGIVEYSDSELFRTGDQVIVTGYDLGMNTAGGFGQYIHVPAEWVVKLPQGLSMKESMIIGTAGFTAGISVLRMSELVKPADGKVIVSGATGGVGSVSLALLAKLGYRTVAITGKESEHDFLQSLGTAEIISRDEFQSLDKRPMLSAQYAGAIDTVGGPILENILKMLMPLGAVTTCGSVSATQLNTSVFPFILRGITLIGISAQNYPSTARKSLWDKLATNWKPDNLLELYTEIKLNEVKRHIDLILAGKLKGRTIVNMMD
ncbi:MAG: YhdH/YhfP family quinone oxidoreductase [Bacteroidota bacterium]|nr:YhdH/YhfP family quinone oxidoreductase [Bacteroidota bacterium]